jgi:hypothetical protein
MRIRPLQALAAQRDKPFTRVTRCSKREEFSFNNRALSGPRNSAGLIMAYSGNLFVRSTVKKPSADPLLYGTAKYPTSPTNFREHMLKP